MRYTVANMFLAAFWLAMIVGMLYIVISLARKILR